MHVPNIVYNDNVTKKSPMSTAAERTSHMKKRLFLIITLSMAATTFWGCSQKNPKAVITTTTADPTIESTTDETEPSTEAPTEVPTTKPTEPPTVKPTETPTEPPTAKPTEVPTEPPTAKPTEAPTEPPTAKPTEAPTEPSTAKPTEAPTEPPTAKPTVAPTEPPTAPKIVDYITEETSVSSNYKYGLKKITTTYNNYYVYSDDSKQLDYSYTNDTYDYSGYAATDSELLEESINTAAANMAYYNEVLTLVNEIRAEVGVQPLTLDTALCQAATMRSIEMNYSTQFSHTRPNGEKCFSVFTTFSISYNSAGENIAAGYHSPSAVVEGWKNSPGHYSNMINSGYNKIGIGMSIQPFGYGIYWTQLFTN